MQRPVAGQKRCQTLFILPRKKVAIFTDLERLRNTQKN